MTTTTEAGGMEARENLFAKSLRTYADIAERYELHVEAYGMRDCARQMEADSAEIMGLRAALATARHDESLESYLRRQWEWSKQTFGPALRTKGIVQHITKELREIESDPHDLSEWVDVIILAMDGFWRHGGKPEALLATMQAKQDKNFARSWPDWRTASEDQAIEHDRSGEAPHPSQTAGVAEGTLDQRRLSGADRIVHGDLTASDDGNCCAGVAEGHVIEATQVTLGEGLVDITRIDHEGRTGVLFRPRAGHIPFGRPGELPEGTYWPVKGDVVLWVSGEGPGVAIKALSELATSQTAGGDQPPITEAMIEAACRAALAAEWPNADPDIQISREDGQPGTYAGWEAFKSYVEPALKAALDRDPIPAGRVERITELEAENDRLKKCLEITYAGMEEGCDGVTCRDETMRELKIRTRQLKHCKASWMYAAEKALNGQLGYLRTLVELQRAEPVDAVLSGSDLDRAAAPQSQEASDD